MNHRPLRILQAGLGARGRMWAEIVTSLGDVTLAGAVDLSEAARNAFRERYPAVPVFSDLQAALAAERYDAAVLVTPPDGRLPDVRRIVDAGLALLAEKPLALELAEAVELVRLAEDAGVPLMVGLNFRYLPVSQQLRGLLAAGMFGRLGNGQFVYVRNRDGRRPELNKYPLTMRHPMMLEQSIHHLDLIRFCYGREVEHIVCRTWNPPWSMYAHYSNVSCLLALEGGVEVNYIGTWTSGWNELEFQWRTDCEAGVIVQRELFDSLATAATGDPALTPVPLPPCRPFYDDTAALLQRFVDHLRGTRELECSGRDHLRSLALCFAAIESSTSGRAVELAQFYRRYAMDDLVEQGRVA